MRPRYREEGRESGRIGSFPVGDRHKIPHSHASTVPYIRDGGSGGFGGLLMRERKTELDSNLHGR